MGNPQQAAGSASALDASALGKLKWRCRRGLLENDLLIEKFFTRHESGLTLEQVRGLTVLMDLSDHDLLNLLLRPHEPEAAIDTQEVREVLNMLRP